MSLSGHVSGKISQTRDLLLIFKLGIIFLLIAKTTSISKHARSISVNPTTSKLYVTISGIFKNSLFVLEF